MNDNKLETVANISQLISLYLLLQDASNNDLMRELQNQNTEYFERIINDLQLIKNKLGIKEEL